jgi:3-hydroxybutyryl-CoA dehydrogenase
MSEAIGKVPVEAKDAPGFVGNRILIPMINEAIFVLHEGFGDSKYRPCPIWQQMVDARYLGRKSGRGFYRYDQ